MSEEKLVSAAAKSFSAGLLHLSVKCWFEDQQPSNATIHGPIWSQHRREYMFTLEIDGHAMWAEFPNVGQSIIVADLANRDRQYRMKLVGDENGKIPNRSRIRVSFCHIDVTATPGPGFLQDMFPSLSDTMTPKTLVKPDGTELPPELQKDRKLILRTKGLNEYPIEIADFKYNKNTKRYELKVVTWSPQGINREHFIDRDIQIISQRECLFEGKFECYASACIEYLGDPEDPDRTLFVSIAAKAIPMANAPAGSPTSILDKPWHTKCGIGVGNPNCVDKVTLRIPDLEDPEFTKLPTDLEIISQIAGRIGTVYHSPIVAEAALQDLEKIKARLLSCMENGGPVRVELNQVWIQAGVCYVITSIVDRNVVLHALMPTGRADHGCVQGRTVHVDSIKKSFAYIGSVADAVNHGFIR